MRRSQGFTLLEVMIALGILAVALVALLGLRNRDIALEAYARDLTRATLLARGMVLEREAGGAPELGYSEGDFGADAPGFVWRRQVTPFLAELIGDRVREVRVTVLWGERDREDGRVEVTRYVEAG